MDSSGRNLRRKAAPKEMSDRSHPQIADFLLPRWAAEFRILIPFDSIEKSFRTKPLEGTSIELEMLFEYKFARN